MKRTVERVLAIISAILIGLGILIIVFLTVGMGALFKMDEFKAELVQDLMEDPQLTLTEDEVVAVLQLFESFISFGWVFVIIGVIALVLTIVGAVQVGNPAKVKAAGVMFILGGIMAGVITLPSILLYIAAGMAFIRKPPVPDQTFRPLHDVQGDLSNQPPEQK